MNSKIPMRGNLSAWALTHQTLVLFMILASAAAGLLAYFSLGRAEDPSYTWKAMTIRTAWPGATADEVERLVTDPIEKKLEEMPYYDFTRSYSKPGESVVILTLKDFTPAEQVQDLWYQARKKVGDIRDTLPAGIAGPFFNDEFGDVYSFIQAFMGEDYSPAQMKKIVEEVRARLLKVEGVEKIDLFGVQEEKIYVELSSRRLASYGVSGEQVIQAIRRNNTVLPSGSVDAGAARVFVRVEADFAGVEAIRAIPIESAGRLMTVGDVAEVRRGYVDPKVETMRFRGRDAIGLGIVMAKGRNVLALGSALDAAMEQIKANLPAGVEVGAVANQAEVVDTSIDHFVRSLVEAVAIVLVVSFISLGWRAGVVVAFAVPLVLGLTLVSMLWMGIDLHRISLGALIIALGLLVDDAIIAVEIMAVKMRQGWSRMEAGSFAYRSTAFPMLTGTVVTAAGFLPIGLARSSSGEYTNSIFWVVTVALLLSWVVAVLVTPYLGYHLLPRGRSKAHSGRTHSGGDQDGIYDTRIYRWLRHSIEICVRARWVTIGVTVAAFIASVIGFGHVPRQFFPSSSRLELVVDIRLAEGSSFEATAAEVSRMEKFLESRDAVADWTVYTGAGSPRFFLTFDKQLQNANFAQVVIMAKGIAERDALAREIMARAPQDFPAARIRVSRLEVGPPVGYPVQFRVIGGDPAMLRDFAYRVRDTLHGNANLTNVNLDWDELAKRVRIQVDPAKAQALGFTRDDLARVLQVLLSGAVTTQYREGTELIDVVMRAAPEERLDLGQWRDLNIPIPTAQGGWVPLGQIATIHYELEEPVLWRRSRQTVMTVRGDVTGGLQPPMVSAAIDRQLDAIRAVMPDGYRIEVGGAAEASAKGNASLVKVLPLMLLAILGMLMIQLQRFSLVALVLLTAPLGLIGVTASLLLTGMPFGFVATLGTIALSGIIMRNSVILVDQIKQDRESGMAPWDAVIDATVRRARPILLTAAAAILAMIPLARTAFWGPMAVAIMGGLASATLLTLYFVPALYAAAFRVRPQQAPTAVKATPQRPFETGDWLPGQSPAE
ncbi:drug-resistance cell envelope-like protein [Skermanella aerolata]|uniref:Drug-resistance cell envelope-like protein n=1 Tax=Skermanella aerolata TaxID=393310 RepID=A0A512DUS2_9PROT|nr:efflux RND transporter permease subunit [Skermanella aerolata]KJB92410.1 Acr/RND family transmembrane transporter [Skermanella aerolata KACC 11604]GEO39990.1 drug-resistance cell envelope-like protein [Skermanella aerolata]